MLLGTASEVISFAKKLEADGAVFYGDLAKLHPEDREALLSLAGENKRNVVQIDTAYYGGITDALEGCFSFSMDPDNYTFDTRPADNENYPNSLQRAAAMDDAIMRFYTDAASQSKSLMTDVSRTFALLARKRGSRLEKLKSLAHQ